MRLSQPGNYLTQVVTAALIHGTKVVDDQLGSFCFPRTTLPTTSGIQITHMLLTNQIISLKRAKQRIRNVCHSNGLGEKKSKNLQKK